MVRVKRGDCDQRAMPALTDANHYCCASMIVMICHCSFFTIVWLYLGKQTQYHSRDLYGPCRLVTRANIDVDGTQQL